MKSIHSSFGGYLPCNFFLHEFEELCQNYPDNHLIPGWIIVLCFLPLYSHSNGDRSGRDLINRVIFTASSRTNFTFGGIRYISNVYLWCIQWLKLKLDAFLFNPLYCFCSSFPSFFEPDQHKFESTHSTFQFYVFFRWRIRSAVNKRAFIILFIWISHNNQWDAQIADMSSIYARQIV